MLPRQMSAVAERGKQPFRGAGAFLFFRLEGFGCGEVVGHCLPRDLIERHQPFLVALAAYHDHAGVVSRRRARQRHQFRHPKAGGVEHFEQAIEPHCAKPLRIRCFARLRKLLGARQHAIDVGDRQYLWQAATAFRSGQDRRRILAANPLVQEEAEQMPHRRQPSRHAG